MSSPDHDTTTDDRSTMSTPEPDRDPTSATTTSATATSVPPRRVHPFNTFFGLLFLAAAGSWLADDQGYLQGVELGRLVAVVLIVLGGLGLLATIVVGRRARRGRHPVREPVPDDV
jgi:hypothetical protein